MASRSSKCCSGATLSAKLDASPTRARAREACEYVLGKYEAQITSKLQKADDTQTVGVHAQIRAQLHDLKDAKERMSVLAKHGSDLTLISAALSAPAYVSGLTSAEISLLRSNLEKHADPAVIKERKFMQGTLAEIERGVRAVRSRIANEGGLHANAA